MADVNRGNRPLSPHLQIYRPTLQMTLSALHRISGIALTLGCVIVVIWLFAAATSPEFFATVERLMTSWIGNLILFGSAVTLWYHALNGLRHLAWDAGWGFELETVNKTGKAVLVGVAVLTVATLLMG
jgi:succinate dehydrogenase / fumarate reductase cytochrome b subunit